VIGVVANIHESSIETAPNPDIYVPVTQSGDISGSELIARSGLPIETLGPSVMRTLRSINPGQPATSFIPIQSIVDSSISPRRFFAVLVGIFAGFGLLLASLGIYGVISYSVSRQTQEIGIRMALGATRQQVQMRVIARTLRIAFIGIAVGTGASFAVSKTISSMLFGTAPTDPITFAGMIVVLIGVALLAGYLPARRASRIDPVTAIRSN
jgi:ABC-type antimicrobial peptide transport system permease subunit